MPSRSTTAALLALTAILPFATARAQSAAPSGPSTPQLSTLHVTTRETIVDVLVADDKGNPVRGLTRSDFAILEDDKPQPIRGFSEYDKTIPPPPPRTLPPNTYTNARTLPANGPIQIFLFDLIGTSPDIMERASKYIADYLRTMPTGTQVVLFGLYPREHLVLLHDFTTDGPSAAAAVDALNVEWIHDPVAGKPILMAGMNQIADYVASIHGRKNLIWIVPGMPLMIDRDGGLASNCAAGPPDLTFVHRVMDLYDRFTQEQIALYPFDPNGVHGMGCATLDEIEVTEATGGSIGNTNDYKAELTTIVDQSSHFYTLSYIPPRPETDHHFHPIKIIVNRPGLHLTYRNGYNDEQPDPPAPFLLHDMIQGPMRLGAIPATQLLFDMHIQPGTDLTHLPAAAQAKVPHTKGAPYTALFQFDPTQIALTQNPDGTRAGSIEIDLGAFDSFSQLVTSRSQTFKLTITPAQYPAFLRNRLEFPLPIDLPSGQLTLRAGLFDTAANKAGTLEIPLTIPRR